MTRRIQGNATMESSVSISRLQRFVARLVKIYKKPASTTKATASLLGIPRELRDKIYYELLHHWFSVRDNPGPWIVNTYPTQPAILRVNRQIRQEAMPEFHCNYFELEIRDLKLEPHSGHWCWPLVDSLDFKGRRDWTNFMDWLKMAHDGKLVPEQILHKRELEKELGRVWDVDTLVPASCLVELMKDDSWEKVETALELYLVGLEAMAQWIRS